MSGFKITTEHRGAGPKRCRSRVVKYCLRLFLGKLAMPSFGWGSAWICVLSFGDGPWGCGEAEGKKGGAAGGPQGGFLKSQGRVLCLHSEGQVSPMSLQSRGSVVQESHRHVGKVCGHQWLLQKSPCMRPHCGGGRGVRVRVQFLCGQHSAKYTTMLLAKPNDKCVGRALHRDRESSVSICCC